MVTKRFISNTTEWTDYDSVITGGSGLFLGATGQITLVSNTFVPDTMAVKDGVVQFELWVPNLPLRGGNSTYTRPKTNRSLMLHPLLSPVLLLVLGAKLLLELAI